MTEEPPIACSLDADDLASRLRLVAEVGAAHLISREAAGATQVLRFRRGDGVRRSLEDVIAADARCCPFLELELIDEGEALVLTIEAPAEGAPVAAQLASAFAAT